MKDTRFIELVNLYIDRQVTPEEAAELELEIQGNPARRRVYQQYCRMHRATKLAYDSFRAHAEQDGQAARQPATIAHIQSRQRQRRMRWAYAASGLAAAACVALFVMRPAVENPISAAAPTQIASVTTPAVVAPTLKPVVPEASLPAVQRTVMDRDYAALLTSYQEEERRMLALPTRASTPQFESLFDDGVFETHNTLPIRNSNQQNRRNPRLQTEFTAFQFQR